MTGVVHDFGISLLISVTHFNFCNEFPGYRYRPRWLPGKISRSSGRTQTEVEKLLPVPTVIVWNYLQWGRHAEKIERKEKRGFVKGRFWRMCPRSGFWYRGARECTLVQFLGSGEHPNFRFFFRAGEHSPKPPFWKQPFFSREKIVRKSSSAGSLDSEHVKKLARFHMRS